MKLTALEIRIDGCQKRIDKLNQKIARLENQITKKKQRIASGKEENNKYPSGEYFLNGEIEWHLDDIERAKKDLKDENIKLNEYIRIKKEELKKESSIPHVQAVEDFLQSWKEKADKYYREEVEALRKWKAEYKIYYDEKMKELEAEFGYKIHCYNKEVEEREKELKIDYKYKENYIKNRWTIDVIMLSAYKGKKFDDKLDSMLNDEVDRKRVDLYTRCSAKVGVITDASRLYVGANLSLNGFVVGEKGKAQVQTIYAGGYAVQCLHYRVLIK